MKYQALFSWEKYIRMLSAAVVTDALRVNKYLTQNSVAILKLAGLGGSVGCTSD